MRSCSCIVPLACLALAVHPTLRAQDVFDARPQHVTVEKNKPASEPASTSGHAGSTSASSTAPKGDVVRLRPGEVREVFRSSHNGNPELAFYLPPEGVGIVQLIVETKGSQVSYFLKGLKAGRTVGGAVERHWLDRGGFSPRNPADEARIQAAVKKHPLRIFVE